MPAGGAVPGGTAAVMVTNCNLPLRTLQQLEDAGPALDAFLFFAPYGMKFSILQQLEDAGPALDAFLFFFSGMTFMSLPFGTSTRRVPLIREKNNGRNIRTAVSIRDQ